ETGTRENAAPAFVFSAASTDSAISHCPFGSSRIGVTRSAFHAGARPPVNAAHNSLLVLASAAPRAIRYNARKERVLRSGETGLSAVNDRLEPSRVSTRPSGEGA